MGPNSPHGSNGKSAVAPPPKKDDCTIPGIQPRIAFIILLTCQFFVMRLLCVKDSACRAKGLRMDNALPAIFIADALALDFVDSIATPGDTVIDGIGAGGGV